MILLKKSYTFSNLGTPLRFDMVCRNKSHAIYTVNHERFAVITPEMDRGYGDLNQEFFPPLGGNGIASFDTLKKAVEHLNNISG